MPCLRRRLMSLLSLFMKALRSWIDVFWSSGLHTVLFYENILFSCIERSGRMTVCLTLMNEVRKACWLITDLVSWFAKEKSWATYQLQFEGWLQAISQSPLVLLKLLSNCSICKLCSKYEGIVHPKKENEVIFSSVINLYNFN